MSIAKLLGAAGVTAAGVIGSAVASKLVDKTADALVNTSLDKAIAAIVQQMANGAGSNYIKATQSVRVEPFVIVDDRAVRLSYIRDIMNTAQRLFTSYYLLSVAAENTIGSVKVSKYLDKFAPDRDLTAATLGFLSTESYQFGLPFVGEAAGLDRYSSYCTEANNPIREAMTPASGSSSSVAANTAKVVQDVQNLAVGQIVDLTITRDGKEGKQPIMIRLRPIGMTPMVMKEVLAVGGEDRSTSARLRAFRVGEKTLWGDLVFNQDKIDRYRRAAMADKSGYFRKVHNRANKNWLANMLTGTPSIGDAASMAITTTDTIRELEADIGGKISHFETRQRIFEDSMLMLLFVVDDDREVVSIYTRDIDDVGTYTLRDLKGPTNSNNDLADIMRSYMEGRVPGRL